MTAGHPGEGLNQVHWGREPSPGVGGVGEWVHVCAQRRDDLRQHVCASSHTHTYTHPCPRLAALGWGYRVWDAAAGN